MDLVCSPVFFNLFAAAKPHTSMKITCGTPCNDPESSDVPEVKATECLRTYFSSRAEPPWHKNDKTDKDGQL